MCHQAKRFKEPLALERYELCKVAVTTANDGDRWYFTGKTVRQGQVRHPPQPKIRWPEFQQGLAFRSEDLCPSESCFWPSRDAVHTSRKRCFAITGPLSSQTPPGTEAEAAMASCWHYFWPWFFWRGFTSPEESFIFLFSHLWKSEHTLSVQSPANTEARGDKYQTPYTPEQYYKCVLYFKNK